MGNKDLKLYFLDEKSRNKSYNHFSNECNVDVFQFQKPKELLRCLTEELISNPLDYKYVPPQI